MIKRLVQVNLFVADKYTEQEVEEIITTSVGYNEDHVYVINTEESDGNDYHYVYKVI